MANRPIWSLVLKDCFHMTLYQCCFYPIISCIGLHDNCLGLGLKGYNYIFQSFGYIISFFGFKTYYYHNVKLADKYGIGPVCQLYRLAIAITRKLCMFPFTAYLLSRSFSYTPDWVNFLCFNR